MTRQRLLVAVLLLARRRGRSPRCSLFPRLGRRTVLSGYIEGEPLYLAAPIAGTVKAMYVVRGQDVAAGREAVRGRPAAAPGPARPGRRRARRRPGPGR